MIQNKSQLKYYLECDRIALGVNRRKPKLFSDETWKFQRIMRKLDYAYTNNNKLSFVIYKAFYKRYSIKLGFSIPFNKIGPGLSIVHYGTIVISNNVQIGSNCRIHTGVNIGANAGEKEAALIGDNVYIGPGAKIIGNICIGDGVCIGANAVVVKDVESGITVGGVPAKKISDNNSDRHLVKATETFNKI